MTKTTAMLEISNEAYQEVREKLEDAGYNHLFDANAIHMDGITLAPAGPPAPPRAREGHPTESFKSAQARVRELAREMLFAPRVFIGDGYIRVTMDYREAVLILEQAKEFHAKLGELVGQLEIHEQSKENKR
jgi:hypothetical protein